MACAGLDSPRFVDQGDDQLLRESTSPAAGAGANPERFSSRTLPGAARGRRLDSCSCKLLRTRMSTLSRWLTSAHGSSEAADAARQSK